MCKTNRIINTRVSEISKIPRNKCVIAAVHIVYVETNPETHKNIHSTDIKNEYVCTHVTSITKLFIESAINISIHA